jgi:hypothetical protein
LTAPQQAEARRRRAEGATLSELTRSYVSAKARFRGLQQTDHRKSAHHTVRHN